MINSSLADDGWIGFDIYLTFQGHGSHKLSNIFFNFLVLIKLAF